MYYGPVGWTWVSAPWMWGYGPRPWYGPAGPGAFAWHRHGWASNPRRWRYVPAPARPAAGARERSDGAHDRGARGEGGAEGGRVRPVAPRSREERR